MRPKTIKYKKPISIEKRATMLLQRYKRKKRFYD